MKRVLLVDDEVHVLSALQRIMRPFFQEYEIEIEAFSDPEQALLRCGETSFDIVMSDYRMPGLSGADFLQMVKGIQPYAVRLMLSASTEFTEVLNAINRAEVFRYIAKPWDGAEMQKIFLQAFKRHDEALRARPKTELSAQQIEARRLENEEPGITQVRRDVDGAIYLD